MKPKRESLPTDIHKWRWWYSGKTPEGVTAHFSGSIEAPNERMGNTALEQVEQMMRTKHPEIRWMQGRNIEDKTGGVRYGPTVQRGKFIRPGPDANKPKPKPTEVERQKMAETHHQASTTPETASYVGDWRFVGWVIYQQHHSDPKNYDFQAILQSALRCSHGETRIQIDRQDKQGVNIWYHN